MNYLTVDLYKDFKCIAGACPNTCCAGWRISIDQTTCKKMKEHEEQLGVLAEDWLIETGNGICARLENQRCYMLDNNNLCKVVLKLGSEYLSDTCQIYPRKWRQYGSILEGYLSMSCPHVVDRLMNKECIQFDFTEDESPAPLYAYTKLYLYESSVRTGIIEVLQHYPQITLLARLFASWKILESAIQFYQKWGQPDYHSLSPSIDLYFQENTLYSLDSQLSYAINEANRYNFLKKFQTVLYGHPTFGRFSQLIELTNTYFTQSGFEQYLSDIALFRAAIQDYAFFYTNFWVYRIFSDCLGIPDYERVKTNFIYIAAEFCLIQTIALVSFTSNGKKLNRDEYVYIISSVSRLLEHDKTFQQHMTDKLVENHTISAAGLLLMILI